MQMCLLLQPPDLREGDEHGHAMAARLHAVEKHLRKNPLQGGTFYDKLQRSTCISSQASPTCGMNEAGNCNSLMMCVQTLMSCLGMDNR